MKNRFKFRVWDKENFNYLEFEGFKKGEIEFNFDIDTNSIWIEFDHNKYILEQCTGIKDKNGKLIYEGDIVKITRESWTKERYNRFYIVCWDRTQWQLGLIKYQRPKAQPNRRPDRKMPFKNIVSFADYTPLKEFALCKVIGNFYENPELLESNQCQEKQQMTFSQAQKAKAILI